MILLEHFFGNRRHFLAINFHDNAKGTQVRIHPLKWHALFDIKLMIWVFIKYYLGQQGIDRHYSRLTLHENPTIRSLFNDFSSFINLFNLYDFFFLTDLCRFDNCFFHVCLIFDYLNNLWSWWRWWLDWWCC